MLPRGEITRVYPPPPPSGFPLLPLVTPPPSVFPSSCSWSTGRAPPQTRQAAGSGYPGPPPPSPPPPRCFAAPFWSPFPKLCSLFPAPGPQVPPIPPPPQNRSSAPPNSPPFLGSNPGGPTDSGACDEAGAPTPGSTLSLSRTQVGTDDSGGNRLGTLALAGPDPAGYPPRGPRGPHSPRGMSLCRSRSRLSVSGLPRGDASRRTCTADLHIGDQQMPPGRVWRPAGTVSRRVEGTARPTTGAVECDWSQSESAGRLAGRSEDGVDKFFRDRSVEDTGGSQGAREERRGPGTLPLRRVVVGPSCSKSCDGDGDRLNTYGSDNGEPGQPVPQKATSFFSSGTGLSRGEGREATVAPPGGFWCASGGSDTRDAASSPRGFSGTGNELACDPSVSSPGEGALHPSTQPGQRLHLPPGSTSRYSYGDKDPMQTRLSGESPCRDAFSRERPASTFFGHGREPQRRGGVCASWDSGNLSPRQGNARASSSADRNETGRVAEDSNDFAWSSTSVSPSFAKPARARTDASIPRLSRTSGIRTLGAEPQSSEPANFQETATVAFSGLHVFPATLSNPACRSAADGNAGTPMATEDDGETAMAIDDDEQVQASFVRACEVGDLSRGRKEQSFRSISTSDTLVEVFCPLNPPEAVSAQSVSTREKYQGKKGEPERASAFATGKSLETVAGFQEVSGSHSQLLRRSFREVRLAGSTRGGDRCVSPVDSQAELRREGPFHPTRRFNTGSASAGTPASLSCLPQRNGWDGRWGTHAGDKSCFCEEPASPTSSQRAAPARMVSFSLGPPGTGAKNGGREDLHNRGEDRVAGLFPQVSGRERRPKRRNRPFNSEWREESRDVSPGSDPATARNEHQIRGSPSSLLRLHVCEENGQAAVPFNANQAAREALDRVEASIQRDAPHRLKAAFLGPGTGPPGSREAARGAGSGAESPGAGPGDRQGPRWRNEASSDLRVGPVRGSESACNQTEGVRDMMKEEEQTAAAVSQRADTRHVDFPALFSERKLERDNGKTCGSGPGRERGGDAPASYFYWPPMREGTSPRVPGLRDQNESDREKPGPPSSTSLSSMVSQRGDPSFRGPPGGVFESLPFPWISYSRPLAPCNSGGLGCSFAPQDETPRTAFSEVRILRLTRNSRSPTNSERAKSERRVRDAQEARGDRLGPRGPAALAVPNRWRDGREPPPEVPPPPRWRLPEDRQRPAPPSFRGSRGRELRTKREGGELASRELQKQQMSLRGNVEEHEKETTEMPSTEQDRTAISLHRDMDAKDTGSPDSSAAGSPQAAVCLSSPCPVPVSPSPSTPPSSASVAGHIDQVSGSVRAQSGESVALLQGTNAARRQGRHEREVEDDQTGRHQREDAESRECRLDPRDPDNTNDSNPLHRTQGLSCLATVKEKGDNQQEDRLHATAPPERAGDRAVAASNPSHAESLSEAQTLTKSLPAGEATEQGRKGRWRSARRQEGSENTLCSQSARGGELTGSGADEKGGKMDSVEERSKDLSSRSVDGKILVETEYARETHPSERKDENRSERAEGGAARGGEVHNAGDGEVKTKSKTKSSTASETEAAPQRIVSRPVDGEGTERSLESPVTSVNETKGGQNGGDRGKVEGEGGESESRSREGAKQQSRDEERLLEFAKDSETREGRKEMCTEHRERKGQRRLARDTRETDESKPALPVPQREGHTRPEWEERRDDASVSSCSHQEKGRNDEDVLSCSPPTWTLTLPPDLSSRSPSVLPPSEAASADSRRQMGSASPHLPLTPSSSPSFLSFPLPSQSACPPSVPDSPGASLAQATLVEAIPRQQSPAATPQQAPLETKGQPPEVAALPGRKCEAAGVSMAAAEGRRGELFSTLPALSSDDFAPRSPSLKTSQCSTEKDNSPTSVFPWRAFQSRHAFPSPSAPGDTRAGAAAGLGCAAASGRRDSKAQAEETGGATEPHKREAETDLQRPEAQSGQKRESRSGGQAANPSVRKKTRRQRVSSPSELTSRPASPGDEGFVPLPPRNVGTLGPDPGAGSLALEEIERQTETESTERPASRSGVPADSESIAPQTADMSSESSTPVSSLPPPNLSLPLAAGLSANNPVTRSLESVAHAGPPVGASSEYLRDPLSSLRPPVTMSATLSSSSMPVSSTSFSPSPALVSASGASVSNSSAAARYEGEPGGTSVASKASPPSTNTSSEGPSPATASTISERLHALRRSICSGKMKEFQQQRGNVFSLTASRACTGDKEPRAKETRSPRGEASEGLGRPHRDSTSTPRCAVLAGSREGWAKSRSPPPRQRSGKKRDIEEREHEKRRKEGIDEERPRTEGRETKRYCARDRSADRAVPPSAGEGGKDRDKERKSRQMKRTTREKKGKRDSSIDAATPQSDQSPSTRSEGRRRSERLLALVALKEKQTSQVSAEAQGKNASARPSPTAGSPSSLSHSSSSSPSSSPTSASSPVSSSSTSSSSSPTSSSSPSCVSPSPACGSSTTSMFSVSVLSSASSSGLTASSLPASSPSVPASSPPVASRAPSVLAPLAGVSTVSAGSTTVPSVSGVSTASDVFSSVSGASSSSSVAVSSVAGDTASKNGALAISGVSPEPVAPGGSPTLLASGAPRAVRVVPSASQKPATLLQVEKAFLRPHGGSRAPATVLSQTKLKVISYSVPTLGRASSGPFSSCAFALSDHGSFRKVNRGWQQVDESLLIRLEDEDRDNPRSRSSSPRMTRTRPESSAEMQRLQKEIEERPTCAASTQGRAREGEDGRQRAEADSEEIRNPSLDACHLQPPATPDPPLGASQASASSDSLGSVPLLPPSSSHLEEKGDAKRAESEGSDEALIRKTDKPCEDLTEGWSRAKSPLSRGVSGRAVGELREYARTHELETRGPGPHPRPGDAEKLFPAEKSGSASNSSCPQTHSAAEAPPYLISLSSATRERTGGIQQTAQEPASAAAWSPQDRGPRENAGCTPGPASEETSSATDTGIEAASMKVSVAAQSRVRTQGIYGGPGQGGISGSSIGQPAQRASSAAPPLYTGALRASSLVPPVSSALGSALAEARLRELHACEQEVARARVQEARLRSQHAAAVMRSKMLFVEFQKSQGEAHRFDQERLAARRRLALAENRAAVAARNFEALATRTNVQSPAHAGGAPLTSARPLGPPLAGPKAPREEPREASVGLLGSEATPAFKLVQAQVDPHRGESESDLRQSGRREDPVTGGTNAHSFCSGGPSTRASSGSGEHSSKALAAQRVASGSVVSAPNVQRRREEDAQLLKGRKRVASRETAAFPGAATEERTDIRSKGGQVKGAKEGESRQRERRYFETWFDQEASETETGNSGEDRGDDGPGERSDKNTEKGVGESTSREQNKIDSSTSREDDLLVFFGGDEDLHNGDSRKLDHQERKAAFETLGKGEGKTAQDRARTAGKHGSTSSLVTAASSSKRQKLDGDAYGENGSTLASADPRGQAGVCAGEGAPRRGDTVREGRGDTSPSENVPVSCGGRGSKHAGPGSTPPSTNAHIYVSVLKDLGCVVSSLHTRDERGDKGQETRGDIQDARRKRAGEASEMEKETPSRSLMTSEGSAANAGSVAASEKRERNGKEKGGAPREAQQVTERETGNGRRAKSLVEKFHGDNCMRPICYYALNGACLDPKCPNIHLS
ncbi:hypothetical protein TGGT1_209440 [Toxoplasma gondii GT1]|uniref:Uncharacterized protein n=2 Tax=Toxoplasma gondii TaxID=5811 RepID=S7UII2_TOXGG|nr:hypothetical protein TGGT1_209440 [Toxoplasma gondii GT1]KAF4645902.1 hypothetical protein TGRH88_021780 [Toxoplasma gondii]